MKHSAQILHVGFVTHDVKQFVTSRPPGLDFEPGQGVEVAIDHQDWRDEGRPFTPTSLPDAPVLEFTIKAYEHDGVTEALHDLGPGDKLRMSDAFGAITYQGPGTFIAGGAGITPFLSIFRSQDGGLDDRQDGGSDGQGAGRRSSLLFSNRTPADIICEKELRARFGDRCHLTCSRESAPGIALGRIDRDFLEEQIDDFGGTFYVCGPPDFVHDVQLHLRGLGADETAIVTEE